MIGGVLVRGMRWARFRLRGGMGHMKWVRVRGVSILALGSWKARYWWLGLTSWMPWYRRGSRSSCLGNDESWYYLGYTHCHTSSWP